MSQISVSAPGKVILHGEHSVVYGKKAVAVSINLRSSLTFQEESEPVVRLRFPEIDLDAKVTLEELKTLRQNVLPATSIPKTFEEVQAQVQILKANQNLLAEFARGSLTKSSQNAPSVNQIKVLEFLSSVCILLFESVPSFGICTSSELPLGAGLGSSASFCVALSCGMLHKAGIIPRELQANDLKMIYELSFFGETIFHGSPSGVDNFVTTYGGAVSFERKEGAKSIEDMAERIQCPDIRILLVDSKVPRSTQEMVQQVKNLKVANEALWTELMDGLGDLAEDAIQEIVNGHGVKASLISRNHSLLQQLGVSHDKLDLIINTAGKFDFAGKLTGAGGGGCAFVHIPGDANEKIVEELRNTLHELGFDTWDTILGGAGVKIE